MSPNQTVSWMSFPEPSYSPTGDPDAPASYPSTFFLEAVRTCECGTKAALPGNSKISLEASFGVSGLAVKARVLRGFQRCRPSRAPSLTAIATPTPRRSSVDDTDECFAPLLKQSGFAS